MEVELVVAIAVAGLVVIAGGGVLAVRAVRHRRAEAAARATKGVGALATELAPLVIGSIQSIVSWVSSHRAGDVAVLAQDGTITLLFSDIQDSTRRNVELGDEQWLEVLHEHDRLVRRVVGRYRGTVVKSQGDGYMVAFTDPRQAVACAVALQRALAGARSRDPLQVRVGIHTGEALSRDGDFFGANVAFAARVAQHARGGQILVSDAVRTRTEDGGDVAFRRGRRVSLRGLPGRHRLHAVEWREPARA